MIVEAGRMALKAHEGQFRRSGEPYITHPVAVATIVAELGLDAQTVAAALLHDAVEDTGLTLEAIESTFGDGVARVVDGVTKLDRLQFNSKEAQQAATIRKMLVAMADDWRVLLIKLADRLHNMRTLAVMPEWKQRRTAQETFDVYAPLAHRLGVQQVRWQLEDLAFATLHPKRYAEIEQMVAARAPPARGVPRAGAGARAPAARRDGHRGRRHRAPEAPVVHLREDGRPGQGVRRHQRPGGHPGRRGLGEGLLGRPRRHPRHLGPRARPLQGLHQHAQVQHVPVAAHDGHRARGQAGRGADPDLGDAPPGRVRHRRALGLQVQGGQLLGDGLVAADRRLRPPDRRPHRVPRGAQARPGAGRGLRLHAQGQGHRPAGPLHPGRLRLRHPHRGRAPLHRRPGQRPPGAARDAAHERGHGRDLHLEVAHGRTLAGLAPDRRLHPGPLEDPPVVQPGAAGGRHRERPRGAGPRPAPRRPAPAQAAWARARWARWPRP